MSAAANPLLQAIHARLAADATLTALIGTGGIHDRLLPRAAMPCLVIAELRTEDFSTATEQAEEHFLVLDAWSDAQGQKQAQEIAARVRALLHDANLTLAGARLVSLMHRTTRTRRELKTRCHIATMQFRAVTE